MGLKLSDHKPSASTLEIGLQSNLPVAQQLRQLGELVAIRRASSRVSLRWFDRDQCRSPAGDYRWMLAWEGRQADGLGRASTVV